MSGLQRKVFHPCDCPAITVQADYRWTCPECDSTWRYIPCTEAMKVREFYGFLGLRTRVRYEVLRGWWTCEEHTFQWVTE